MTIVFSRPVRVSVRYFECNNRTKQDVTDRSKREPTLAREYVLGTLGGHRGLFI